MTSQITKLMTLIGQASHPFSPAMSLDLPVGTDEEGWAIYETFSVDDIVINPSGKTFRIIGFTLGNTILVKQHGLDIDPMISSIEFRSEGLSHPKNEYTWMHKNGLIHLG